MQKLYKLAMRRTLCIREREKSKMVSIVPKKWRILKWLLKNEIPKEQTKIAPEQNDKDLQKVACTC